jgi:hypothetical protein
MWSSAGTLPSSIDMVVIILQIGGPAVFYANPFERILLHMVLDQMK